MGRELPDHSGMLKCTLISGLWLLALWAVGGPVHVYIDVPRVLMLLPAAGGAAAVWGGLMRYDAWTASRKAQSAWVSLEDESTIGVKLAKA